MLHASGAAFGVPLRSAESAESALSDLVLVAADEGILLTALFRLGRRGFERVG
jgi:hypothetical protein